MASSAARFSGVLGALQRSAALLGPRLPTLTAILLLVLLAWLLARLTWALLPTPPAAQPIYKANAAPSHATFNAGNLASEHLFGQPTVSPTTSNAPETTLALTLNGIVADSRSPGSSQAIILAGGKQAVYGVGTRVPGGAVIKTILADRVLLDLNGRIEALRLPKAQAGTAGNMTETRLPLAPSKRPNLPSPGNLGQLRHQLLTHPERLMDLVRAMPVMVNGKFSGYRVFPAGNPRLFAQTGLKPGDIVTAVNGIALDNPSDSMKILGKLKTSDQVTITFTRNGQQQTEVLQMQDHSQ